MCFCRHDCVFLSLSFFLRSVPLYMLTNSMHTVYDWVTRTTYLFFEIVVLIEFNVYCRFFPNSQSISICAFINFVPPTFALNFTIIIFTAIGTYTYLVFNFVLLRLILFSKLLSNIERTVVPN